MEGSCPLCQLRPVKEKLRLYQTPVCKKCYYAFANRRQIAYFVDMLILQAISMGIGFVAGMVADSAFGGQMTPEQSQRLVFVSMFLGFAVGVLYGIKDGFAGKSFGKWMCGVTWRYRHPFKPRMTI